MKFLIRDEARKTERRTAVTPKDAKTLLDAGFDVSVESSQKRIFGDEEYTAIGCNLVAADTWQTAQNDVTILGLKELPDSPRTLSNSFIHFAHLYKNQTGWEHEISRFVDGGGTLFDLEYLAIDGRRTAAFGYWAGWMGAALAAWRLLAKWNGEAGPVSGVESFPSSQTVINTLKSLSNKTSRTRTAVVIGANGRSGGGATEVLKLAGFQVSKWDMAETRNLDREKLMTHDLLVNCVLMTGPGLQLLSREDLEKSDNKIQMISDVSCDPFSDFNPLPIYDAPTSWDAPFISVGESVELTSIDNLPSLLPRESSEDFSAMLVKSLLRYPDGEEWQNAQSAFNDAVKRAAL